MEPGVMALAPLPTPFTDDASQVSEVRLTRVMRWLSERGVQGWVVASEVGEFCALDLAERKGLLECVVRSAGSGNEVIVHVTAGSTGATLDLVQHASRHGAKAVLASIPLVCSFTDDEIFDYFQVLGRHGHLPVYVIDPTHRLTDPLKARIASVPGTYFDLESGSSIDFLIDGCRCSVSHALGLQGDRELTIRTLIDDLGPARSVKTAFEAMEIDTGPLRGPLQSLAGEARTRLMDGLISAGIL